MFSSVKKSLAILFILFSVSTLFSQKYQIVDVQYDITGKTREYALTQAVLIDKKKVFNDYTEFLTYLNFIEKELNNQRVLDSAEVLPVFQEQIENDVVPVKLIITTKDTFNFIALPYPDFNTNTGLKIKLKIKDYNFLGSMQPLGFDINFAHIISDKGTTDNTIGFNFNADYPFKLGILDSSWNNYLSFDYYVGKTKPELDFSTELSFSLPILTTSLNFSIKQKIILDPDYVDDNDYPYFNDSANFSVPFKVATIDNWGAVKFTPSASFSWNWDSNGLNNSVLFGPTVSFGYSISTGHVNWIENFRKGFEFSGNQSISYNFSSFSVSPTISAEGKYFNASKYIGFDSRVFWFRNLNGTTNIGSRLRGIKDSQESIETSSAVCFNIATSIRVFRTHWLDWGFWDWMRYVDFDLQLSPFIDFALIENSSTESSFSFKDGWYSAGLEVIGFPAKMRSIQGRISFGVDLARTIIPSRFISTYWRESCSLWELTIGIGLLY